MAFQQRHSFVIHILLVFLVFCVSVTVVQSDNAETANEKERVRMNLTTGLITGSTVELKWTPYKSFPWNNQSYQAMYFQNNTHQMYSTVADDEQYSLNLTNLLPNTSYIAWIEITSSNDSTKISESVTFKTDVGYPSNSIEIYVGCSLANSVIIWFTDVGTDLTEYQFYIYYRKRGAGRFDMIHYKFGDYLTSVKRLKNLDMDATYEFKTQIGIKSTINSEIVFRGNFSDTVVLNLRDCYRSPSTWKPSYSKPTDGSTKDDSSPGRTVKYWILSGLAIISWICFFIRRFLPEN